MVRTTQRTPFGQRLSQARRHAKLTQQQLAKKAGLSQGTVSELETIAHGSSHVNTLASICGVNAMWLESNTGDMLEGMAHVAATPIRPYARDGRPSPAPPLTARDLVAQLARLLEEHSTARRATLADLFGRFARAPADTELQVELVALLQLSARDENSSKHQTG